MLRSSPGDARQLASAGGGPASGLYNLNTTSLLLLQLQSASSLYQLSLIMARFLLSSSLQKQPTFVELSEAGIGKGA
jgi:hypothetical protein